MAAIVSGRRSFGCGLVNRTRRMPSTAPTAASRSAKSGRRFVRSRPYELTFWPSSVTSTTPRRASVSTSATMSSGGRLASGPRTDGTMQNAHELSQPVWIVTHAAYGSSRTAESAGGVVRRRGRVGGVQDLDDGALYRRPAQQLGGAGQVVGTEHHVDMAGLLADQLPVLLGQAAADGDLQPRLARRAAI